MVWFVTLTPAVITPAEIPPPCPTVDFDVGFATDCAVTATLPVTEIVEPLPMSAVTAPLIEASESTNATANPPTLITLALVLALRFVL